MNSKKYKVEILKTIVIGVFLRKGAAVSEYFLRLADEFVKLGYRVIVISDENRKDLVNTKSNPMILTWPSYWPSRLIDFIFIIKIIKKYKPEMMIANFKAENFFLIAGSIFGVPHRIAWNHTLSSQQMEVPKWKFWRKRLIYLLTTKIITPSKSTKKDTMETYHIKSNKIVVINNLILNNDNCINSNKEFTIVFVGRFHESKGVDTLIRALFIVKKEFPHIKLELIGDGEKKHDYIELVNKLDLEKNVFFLGRQPREKVLEHFANALFSIAPSHSESFGLIVIESFSTKTPVIGSDTGGIAEIIEDEESGLLFSVGDHHDLASKILLFLKNEKLRKQCGEGAYRCFKQQYDLDQNIGKVAEIFSRDIELK